MSFFDNPIANISGGIHDLGKGVSNLSKNPLVDALAGAALMAFAPETMGAFGSYLGADAGAGATMLGTGVTTGGIAALASGNLGQGLKAGLAAYGGAGAENMLSGMGMPAASAYTPAADVSNGALQQQYSSLFPNSQVGDFSGALPSGAGEGVGTSIPAAATNTGTVSNAISSAIPQDFSWQGLKTYASEHPLITGVAGLTALKAMATPQKLNAPAAKVGNIRQYSYNPYTGQMTAGPITPANQFTGPVTAANYGATGGLVALAHGGGVHHYDSGGATTAPQYTNQQISDYITQNNLSGQALTNAEQQFGVTQNQVNQAMGVTSGNYGQPDPYVSAMPATNTLTQAQIDQLTSTSPTQNPNSLENTGYQLGLNPDAVQAYLASVNPNYAVNNGTVQSTFSQPGLQAAPQLVQQLISEGVNPAQIAKSTGLPESAVASVYAKSTDPAYLQTLIDQGLASGQNYATLAYNLGLNPQQVWNYAYGNDKNLKDLTSGMKSYSLPKTSAQGGLMALANGGAIRRYDVGGTTAAQPISNTDIVNYVQQQQQQFGGDNAKSQAAIAAAMNQYGVTPEQVASALGTSLGTVQSDYNTVMPTGQYATTAAGNAGNTAITNAQIQQAVAAAEQAGGGGYESIQNQMIQNGVSTAQLASALGIDPSIIGTDYSQTVGVQQEGAKLGPTPANTPFANDTQWAQYMDANNLSTNQMAAITGLSPNEVAARYALAEAQLKAQQKPTVNTTTNNTTTQTGPGNVTASTPISYAPSTTLMPSVGGNTGPTVMGGGTVINPNGTITTSPVLPGIPAGGFTGMASLRNAYTQGGGSLGYTNPAPTSMDQFNQEYNTLTGGSQAAYDFLMGKTTQPRGPAKGPVALPYFQAVGMAPKTIGYKLPNGIMATPQSDGSYLGADGNKYNADGSAFAPTKSAAGGLMGVHMAMGGITPNVGHLGGYSDGGRLLRGPGDGVSDSIPATIGSNDPEPARLADGEFVVPARIVSELGNGSTEAGARQLYKMMDRIQNARRRTTGKDAVATNTNAHQYLPA